MKQPYNLIQVFTRDDLKLSGLMLDGDKTKTAALFVHGFIGDFYLHKFYHLIAKNLSEKKNALILAQTRGTGLRTEFIKRDGSEIYLGSYYEKIEEAHLDISAFLDYLLKDGYQKICLIGFSYGTIKVIRYLFEGQHKDNISKLVLLGPFDKNAFMERKAPGKWPEFLNVARQKIAAGQGQDIVPVPEYEDFPTTYETFLSWYHQSDLNCVWDFYRKDYDFPILKRIDIPVLVISGENDDRITYPEFNVRPESALVRIKKHIKNCQTVLIPGSGHTFFGYDQQLADEVAKFI